MAFVHSIIHSSLPSLVNAPHNSGTHARHLRNDSQSLHHRPELRASEFADCRRSSSAGRPLVFRYIGVFHLDKWRSEVTVQDTFAGILAAFDSVDGCWRGLRDS